MELECVISCTIPEGSHASISIKNYSLPIYFYRIDAPTTDFSEFDSKIRFYDLNIIDGSGVPESYHYSNYNVHGRASFMMRGILPKIITAESKQFIKSLLGNTIVGYIGSVNIEFSSEISDPIWIQYLESEIEEGRDDSKSLQYLESCDNAVGFPNNCFMTASLLSNQSPWHLAIMKRMSLYKTILPMARNKLKNHIKEGLSEQIWNIPYQSGGGQYYTYPTTIKGHSCRVLIGKITTHVLKECMLASKLVMDDICHSFPLFICAGRIPLIGPINYTNIYSSTSELDINDNHFIILENYGEYNADLGQTFKQQLIYANYCLWYYLGINKADNILLFKKDTIPMLVFESASQSTYPSFIDKHKDYDDIVLELNKLYAISHSNFANWDLYLWLITNYTPKSIVDQSLLDFATYYQTNMIEKVSEDQLLEFQKTKLSEALLDIYCTLTCDIPKDKGIYIAIKNYSLPIYFYRADQPKYEATGEMRYYDLDKIKSEIGDAQDYESVECEKIEVHGHATFIMRGMISQTMTEDSQLFIKSLLNGSITGYLFTDHEQYHEEVTVHVALMNYGEWNNWADNHQPRPNQYVIDFIKEADDIKTFDIKYYMWASIFSTLLPHNSNILDIAGAGSTVLSRKRNVLAHQLRDGLGNKVEKYFVSTIRDPAIDNDPVDFIFDDHNMVIIFGNVSMEEIKISMILSKLAMDGICNSFPLFVCAGYCSQKNGGSIPKGNYNNPSELFGTNNFIILERMDGTFTQPSSKKDALQFDTQLLYVGYVMNFYLGINHNDMANNIMMKDNYLVLINYQYTQYFLTTPTFFNSLVSCNCGKQFRKIFKASSGKFIVWQLYFWLIHNAKNDRLNMSFVKFALHYQQCISILSDAEILQPKAIPKYISPSKPKQPRHKKLELWDKGKTKFCILFVHQGTDAKNAAINMKGKVEKGINTVRYMIKQSVSNHSILVLNDNKITDKNTTGQDVIFYFVNNNLQKLNSTLLKNNNLVIINVKNYDVKKSWKYILTRNDGHDNFNKEEGVEILKAINNHKSRMPKRLDYWCDIRIEHCEEATNGMSLSESIGYILKQIGDDLVGKNPLLKAAYGALLVAFSGMIACGLGFGGDCASFLSMSATIVMTTLFRSEVFGYVKAVGNDIWGEIIGKN